MLRPMNEKSRPKPVVSERGSAEAARRQDRLAAALRENLRKRKRQERVRAETPESAPEPQAGEPPLEPGRRIG